MKTASAIENLDLRQWQVGDQRVSHPGEYIWIRGRWEPVMAASDRKLNRQYPARYPIKRAISTRRFRRAWLDASRPPYYWRRRSKKSADLLA